jgi:hypothetical protein
MIWTWNGRSDVTLFINKKMGGSCILGCGLTAPRRRETSCPEWVFIFNIKSLIYFGCDNICMIGMEDLCRWRREGRNRFALLPNI